MPRTMAVVGTKTLQPLPHERPADRAPPATGAVSCGSTLCRGGTSHRSSPFPGLPSQERAYGHRSVEVEVVTVIERQ